MGGAGIATPVVANFYLESPLNIDELIEFKDLSTKQLKANSCKVLVNSVDQRSQILICSAQKNSSIVSFLYLSNTSQLGSSTSKLQKIEKFSSLIPKSEFDSSTSSWREEYDFQFLLEETTRRGSTSIRVSKEKQKKLEQLKDLSLSTCKVDSHSKYLSCEKLAQKGYKTTVEINLEDKQDYFLSGTKR